MFGYIVSIVFLIVGCITGNDKAWFISALFAIAGSISFVSYSVNNLKLLFVDEEDGEENGKEER